MQNHKTVSEKIYQQLKISQNILLVSHKRPDGDTIGANLGMLAYLKGQNKNVTSFCLDPIPKNFNFLSQSHKISTDHTIFRQKYDTVIMLDCASLEYAGVASLVTALPPGYVLINIDHHITNPRYADINLIIDDASSTSEIVYRLLKDWNIVWTKDMATALVAGMIADTEGFKNPATNYQALAATSELIKYGANVYEIANITLNNTAISQLKLWGRALERLTLVDKYNLIYTWITQKDFAECHTDETASEGIANFLHILKEGQIILVLIEKKDGTVKGSLRTTGDIDLTKIAGYFGGGGHKKAAGFSLPGRLVYDNNRLRIV